MKDDFKTLAKFSTENEAQMIKALLDSMGVESQVINGLAADMLPYLTEPVRLVVNAEDYDRARSLLDAKFDKDDLLTGEID